MTWFAIDDRFWSHPKTVCMRESEHYSAALALWAAAGSWCAGHAWNSGVVPAPVLASFGVPDWRQGAALLIDVGLWEQQGGAVVYHDWTDWNGPDAKSWRIDRRRANDRDRQRRRRDGEQLASERRAAARERKAESRRRRCQSGDHRPDCPAGCPARRGDPV